MHNRHFIIVNAEDKDDAKSKVETELMEFGNENNWSSVVQVLEIGNAKDKEGLQNVIDRINKMTGEHTIHTIERNIESLELMIASEKRATGTTNSYHYYTLSKYFMDLHELTSRKGNEITEDAQLENCSDYFGWQFDEYGITNIVFNKEDYEKIYVVEIDMHS